MTIREATIDDIGQLVEMGRRFRASTSYASIVADNPEQMARTAEHLITTEAGVVFVAEDRGGCLVAMIGLLLYPHHISGALTAGEVFWWSEAPGYGLKVFLRARQWAKRNGGQKLQMTRPVAELILAEVYEKVGLHRIEDVWEMDLVA